jgi:hypothetical protein
MSLSLRSKHPQLCCRLADSALLEDGNGNWQQVQVQPFVHGTLFEKQTMKIHEMHLNYKRVSLVLLQGEKLTRATFRVPCGTIAAVQCENKQDALGSSTSEQY